MLLQDGLVFPLKLELTTGTWRVLGFETRGALLAWAQLLRPKRALIGNKRAPQLQPPPSVYQAPADDAVVDSECVVHVEQLGDVQDAPTQPDAVATAAANKDDDADDAFLATEDVDVGALDAPPVAGAYDFSGESLIAESLLMTMESTELDLPDFHSTEYETQGLAEPLQVHVDPTGTVRAVAQLRACLSMFDSDPVEAESMSVEDASQLRELQATFEELFEELLVDGDVDEVRAAVCVLALVLNPFSVDAHGTRATATADVPARSTPPRASRCERCHLVTRSQAVHAGAAAQGERWWRRWWQKCGETQCAPNGRTRRELERGGRGGVQRAYRHAAAATLGHARPTRDSQGQPPAATLLCPVHTVRGPQEVADHPQCVSSNCALAQSEQGQPAHAVQGPLVGLGPLAAAQEAVAHLFSRSMKGLGALSAYGTKKAPADAVTPATPSPQVVVVPLAVATPVPVVLPPSRFAPSAGAVAPSSGFVLPAPKEPQPKRPRTDDAPSRSDPDEEEAEDEPQEEPQEDDMDDDADFLAALPSLQEPARPRVEPLAPGPRAVPQPAPSSGGYGPARPPTHGAFVQYAEVDDLDAAQARASSLAGVPAAHSGPQVMDVSQADLLADQAQIKEALAHELKGPMGSKMTAGGKRRHQLGKMAFEAAENMERLAEERKRNQLTRGQVKMKYGWG